MRHWARLALVPALLAATLLGGVQASSAAAAAQAGHTLWILGYSDQSVTEAISGLAAADPAYRESALQMIQEWKQNGGADFAATTEGGPATHLDAAGLGKLESAVTQRAVPPQSPVRYTRATPSAGGSVSASAGTMSPAVAAVDINDPNTFPVVGTVGSGRLYWTMQPTIFLQRCSPGCVLTDQYQARASINPGATSSYVSSQNFYQPNSGNFANKHFQIWAVCRGRVCQMTNTGNLPSSSYNEFHSYGDRHGNVLTIALTLWVYANPIGDYISRSQKTSDATCETLSVGNACRY